MKPLPTPHNNFFHFALSDVSNARSLLQTQLPQTALESLDLETLQLEPGSFVDAELRERHSDLLFSVCQMSATENIHHRSSIRGKRRGDSSVDETLVYLLFEHKSQVDEYTVIQLLSYLVRIWEKRLRGGLDLCPVLPLVVYHGESVWSAAQSLRELLRAPEALVEYQVDFRYPLLDLHRLADSEILGNPILRSSLKLLKYSRSQQLLYKLGDIMAELVKSLPKTQHREWFQAISTYVTSANSHMDDEIYKQTLESVLPTQYVVGSLADKLLIRGREEGLREGIEKGKLAGRIQVLAEMLGDEPMDDAKLEQLDVDALKAHLEELQIRRQDR